MAGIFACENFDITGIIVVKCIVFDKPVGAYVIVLVYRIYKVFILFMLYYTKKYISFKNSCIYSKLFS